MIITWFCGRVYGDFRWRVLGRTELSSKYSDNVLRNNRHLSERATSRCRWRSDRSIQGKHHAQRESKLAATRNRLRINVEVALEDDDDNPLEAYCQLVYWTLENYPQGHSAESGLLELLEEATRVLKDHRDGIWRNDPRYLKLWVLYANYVEKPTLIYRFLLANEIGTTFALLYEEFAAALERDGRCTPLFHPNIKNTY